MFAKLAVVILTLGAFGCALLQLRHERLHAASQLVRIQLQIRQQDEQLWKLRTEIARLVTPEHVRMMAANLGPLRPLVPERPDGMGETRRAAAPVESKPLEASASAEGEAESVDDSVVFRRERQKPR